MLPLAEALAWLEIHTPPNSHERVAVEQALARTLANPVPATELPPHPVAAIDGWAVRAAETEGASDYAPLPIAGVPVSAGAPMPPGHDAVLPPPWVESGTACLAPVAPGHCVLPTGHDAQDGWVLPAGTILGPLHLALLASLGHSEVLVVRRPRATVRAIPAASGLDTLLAALLETAGAVVDTPPDLILLAGTPPDAFTTLHAHGIAIRPGEGAAIGLIGPTPAILLPGDPVGCATTFALLAAPALRRMAARPEPAPVPATLTRKIASGLGQIDAIRVRLRDGQATPLGPAEHGSLCLAIEADGLVLAPEGSEGYPQGATVQVLPL